MDTAFQADAFQSDTLAFQIDGGAVVVTPNPSRGATGSKAGPFRGPYDSPRKRYPIRAIRTPDEETKALKAMREAEEALHAAENAKQAQAKRDALADVFRKIAEAGVAKAEYETIQADIAEALETKGREQKEAVQAELIQVRKLIETLQEEMQLMTLKRRHEEEEYALMLMLLEE